MGGEKRFASASLDAYWGSPSRGRGKVERVGSCVQGQGITPAWAGKRPLEVRNKFNNRDHPRMGGEKMSLLGNGLSSMGSPPHGRGKAFLYDRIDYHDGITPAWAGKIDQTGWTTTSRRDHPRVGGEKKIRKLQDNGSTGSPPHGRGKVAHKVLNARPDGITPA